MPPVIFSDTIHLKIREEGEVVNKEVYSALVIRKDGGDDITPNKYGFGTKIRTHYRWA